MWSTGKKENWFALGCGLMALSHSLHFSPTPEGNSFFAYGCCLKCQWLHINAYFAPCHCMRSASQGRFVLALPRPVLYRTVSAHQQGMVLRGLWAAMGILFCRLGKGCQCLPSSTASLGASLTAAADGLFKGSFHICL